jgi:hypothetical protein
MVVDVDREITEIGLDGVAREKDGFLLNRVP